MERIISPVPTPRPDPSDFNAHTSAGVRLPEGSRTPQNVRGGRRIELSGLAKAGLGIGAGLGLAVGLSEGIPALAGGQGPLDSAINPDKPKDPNNPFSQLTSTPVLLIAAGILLFVLSRS